MGINLAVFEGNLGRDPELRYTPQGTAVCSLSVAITEFKGSSDTREKETTWVRVTAWEKQAESCAKILKKGSHITVEGRLRESHWQTQSGEKRSALEVTAHRVHFGPKKDGGRDDMAAGDGAAPRF